MKTMKKTAVFLLCLFLYITCFCVYVQASADTINSFSVTAETADAKISVSAWKSDNTYYLFMPSDTNLESLTVSFDTDEDLYLDGELIESGDTLSLAEKQGYSLSCGGENYSLYAFKSEGLPALHITTASGSMSAVNADKSHKEPASILISDGGEIILEKELEYIKGRGNASWTYEKKPYNIKFDKKTDLFGMGKAKKWTLLANYVDKTLLRNHVALSLAQEVNIPFTSSHIYVDLYIDNDYYGSYILCESVEVGETRVDIFDLEGATEDVNPETDLDEFPLGGAQEKNFRLLTAGTQKWAEITNNPEDITGGYLLEFELPDRFVNEPCGFVTNRNQTIVVKAPEYASKEQVKYISSLYQDFEDALYSESGYNSLGKHYTEYIDVESFVKMYILQEFTKNLDAAITSFYIYKDTGTDKFVAAPVWDFDRALGDSFNRFGMNTATPDEWWAGIIYQWTDNSIKGLPTLLNALYRKDDFFALACEMWQNSFSGIFNDEYLKELYAFSTELTSSAVMNSLRWNSFSTTDYKSAETAYRKAVDESLLNFISERKIFLDKGLSASSVRVFYDAGTGKGNMFNANAVSVGEILTLPECTFTHSSMIFDSWNTKADGSGASYMPGDKVTLSSATLTFFAQWKEIPPEEPDSDEPEKELNGLQKFFKAISDFFKRFLDFIRNLFR